MNNKSTITLDYALRNTNPTAFSTMVKPAGSLCNLDCQYCYYLDKAGQYAYRQPLMSPELLEIYVRQYIEANEVPQVTFLWHGGEPLMQGVGFYKRALGLQEKFAAGKKIENVLQTNGTLLNEEWCRFFAKNNFLIGISIDGPQDIHDSFRLNKAGKPSFERVMNGVALLRKYKVEFNTMSVVNKLCEKRGLEIYQFLKSIGSRYMQFLPAVEHTIEIPDKKRALIVPPEHDGARIAPWSVSATGYGEFLNDIFDYWVRNDVGNYFVQIFDSTLAQHCGIPPGLCTMNDTCGEALVVEHNGDVFPCDHFVYPEYRLGNIKEKHLGEIFKEHKRFDFGIKKRNTLPQECLSCDYYQLCRGECPKHRFERAESGDGKKNSLCDGFKMYFKHTTPYMEYMRDLLAAGLPAVQVIPWARTRK